MDSKGLSTLGVQVPKCHGVSSKAIIFMYWGPNASIFGQGDPLGQVRKRGCGSLLRSYVLSEAVRLCSLDPMGFT